MRPFVSLTSCFITDICQGKLLKQLSDLFSTAPGCQKQMSQKQSTKYKQGSKGQLYVSSWVNFDLFFFLRHHRDNDFWQRIKCNRLFGFWTSELNSVFDLRIFSFCFPCRIKKRSDVREKKNPVNQGASGGTHVRNKGCMCVYIWSLRSWRESDNQKKLEHFWRN